MPIIGVSDDKALYFGDGTPLLGRIYKGDEKRTITKNGKQIEIVGKDRDNFRVEFEPQFEFLRPKWEEYYCKNGELPGPKEFGWVELCGNDIETTFPSYMEEYKANEKLIHRCTGNEQVKWWSEEAKDHLTGHKACEMKAGEGHSCNCQMTGRLDIILLEFNNFTGVHGHFLVTTHSFHDIVYITGFLRHLKRRGLQSFESVPFTFGREFRPIPVPITDKSGAKTGERIVKSMSLLYLYLEPEFFKAAFVPEWKARREALLEGLVPLLAEGKEAGGMRKVLGGGGGVRRLGVDEVDPQLVIVEPSANTEPETVTVELDTKAEPPTPEPELTITRRFVATHIKYISNGTQSYMAFIDPNDQPGWLYLKDFEKKFDVLGPKFQEFQLSLKPAESDDAPRLELPESLTVTVESRTKSGKSYWEVTDLKRVEQAQEGGQVAS